MMKKQLFSINPWADGGAVVNCDSRMCFKMTFEGLNFENAKNIKKIENGFGSCGAIVVLLVVWW